MGHKSIEKDYSFLFYDKKCKNQNIWWDIIYIMHLIKIDDYKEFGPLQILVCAFLGVFTKCWKVDIFEYLMKNVRVLKVEKKGCATEIFL